MLIGLLLGKFNRSRYEAPLPLIPVSRRHPRRCDEILRAIGQTLAVHGDEALTDGERIIWNTALVLSFLIGDRKNSFGSDARVRHWSAARIGFDAMNLPEAADCVVSLVKELAHRAELRPSDRYGDAASLLRLADLKRRFRTIEAENDLPAMLDAMVDRTYPWPD